MGSFDRLDRWSLNALLYFRIKRPQIINSRYNAYIEGSLNTSLIV